MDKSNYLKIYKKMDWEVANEELIEDRFFYFGKDLGVFYSPEKTSFRVWSPVADDIKVFIYNNEDDVRPEIVKDLSKSIKGTWYTEIDGDFQNKYHIYHININGNVNQVVDPYTRGLGTNSRLGLIVDLESTNPTGWKSDKRINLEQPQDAVIYEMHIRDFSSADNSGIKYKNKYLSFTEIGTVNSRGLKTGIDHLKELGITHLHLQPVFDFATVDDNSETDYNWGYDPFFYNVPEGSYSTNPADDTRIREFKMMVKSLHDNGIGVIMDVVYNHTYHTENSPFNKIVPYYYYRMTPNGAYSNGSGTGNETASERIMMRKFIVDSVKYWAEEYHIDGFRFDLMALHDKKTMAEIENTLHKIDSSILIYGEPWMGGLSPLSREKQMNKGTQQGMNIAVFNDNYRNAIKGNNDGTSTGFVSGAQHLEDYIKRGVVGAIDYNHHIKDFALEPYETINYVSSHDNLTLWDKLNKSNMHDSDEIRIKMDRLAQGIVFTSQGIPFIHGGEEMLRTKFGNHNSYNAGDRINQIKWERKCLYYDTFCFYKGLIELRKKQPAFRLGNAQQIKNCLSFLETPYNTVGFIIKKYIDVDDCPDILVFYNPNRETIKFHLPEIGPWNVVVDEKQAGSDTLYNITGMEVQLAPISMMVMYK
ncbi:MAG: type I pullulanase [Halanaerobiaceae bacterium]